MSGRSHVIQAQTDAAPWVFTCVAIHVVCDFLLVTRAWFLDGNRLLFAMSVPLSQCSLATIWAVTYRGNLAIRFAVPPIVTAGCWYVLSRLLGWGIGEPASAAWAITLVVQLTLIVLLIHFYRPTAALIRRRLTGDGERVGSPFTFNLRTLLLWSTAIACGFGFIQFGRDRWRWDSNVSDWEYLNAMPIIGLFNAWLAASWLWVYGAGRWRWRGIKCVIVLVSVWLSGYLMPHLIDWTTGSRALEVRQIWMLSAAQSLVLVATLAVVVYARARDASICST